MGAMCGSVLPCPLTAKRNFVQRVLPAARTQSTPATQPSKCGLTRGALHSAVCTGRCICVLRTTPELPLSAKQARWLFIRTITPRYFRADEARYNSSLLVIMLLTATATFGVAAAGAAALAAVPSARA